MRTVKRPATPLADRMPDCAAGLEAFVFEHELDPELAGAARGVCAGEVVVATADGEHGRSNPEALKPVEEVVDERPVAEGHQALVARQGQRPEPRALPADEDDCVHSR